MFYKYEQDTGRFAFGFNMDNPDGEITDENHAALFLSQVQGKEIVKGPGGGPIASDPAPVSEEMKARIDEANEKIKLNNLMIETFPLLLQYVTGDDSEVDKEALKEQLKPIAKQIAEHTEAIARTAAQKTTAEASK
jgi:hypothetical protein